MLVGDEPSSVLEVDVVPDLTTEVVVTRVDPPEVLVLAPLLAAAEPALIVATVLTPPPKTVCEPVVVLTVEPPVVMTPMRGMVEIGVAPATEL